MAASLSAGGGIDLAMAALSAACPLVLAPSTPAGILDTLRVVRPEHLLAGPSVLLQMLDQENAVAEDFRSLKSVTCGGDTVPATLDRRVFDMIGRGINQGYGMTEIGICTGAAMATGPVSGSIGTLLPGFEMVFLSPDGTPVADHSRQP
jgi:acyl-coenzyme A synthetase/AMP-(fatty) acid ligase